MSLQIFAPLQHLFTFHICNKKSLHWTEKSCRVANHLLIPGMLPFCTSDFSQQMVLLRHRSTCDRHVAVCERHSSGSTYYLMHLENNLKSQHNNYLCVFDTLHIQQFRERGLCFYQRGDHNKLGITWRCFSSEEASCCLGPADLYTTTQTHCQEQMTSNVVKVVGHSEDPTSSRFSCVIHTTTGFGFYFATVSVLCA